MCAPAALPATALLGGVCLGAFGPDGFEAFPRTMLAAAWIAAASAIFRPSRLFLCASCIGFLSAGAVLGHRAVDRALRPGLLAWVERESPDRPASDRDPLLVEGRLRADATGAPLVSLSLRIERVVIDGRWTSVDGGALVSVAGAEGRSRSEEWRAGRRVRFPATLRLPATYWNPGVGDARRAVALRGTVVVGSVKSPRLVEVVRRGSWIEEAAASVRGFVRRALGQTVGRWSDRSAAIVTAILIGDRASLDAEVERRLQEAGTYHVMAISGGNIAVLTAAVLLSFALCGVRGTFASVAAIAVLLAYAVLVGGGASVMRATIMAVAYLSARVLDHRAAPFNAVAIALGITVSLDPTAIFDAGFALTFGATIGILVGARLVMTRRVAHPVVRPVAALLGASLAAETTVLPIGLYAFGRLTLTGPVMNLAAIPMMGLAQVAGLAAVLCVALGAIDFTAGVFRALSVAAGFAAHVGATVLVESTSAIDLIPWAARRLPPPSAWILALYFSALATWIGAHARARQEGTSRPHLSRLAKCASIVTLAAIVLMIAAPPGAHALPAHRLSVVFIDVGQGDATLIRFPEGRSFLVDTGGVTGASRFDFGSRVVVPAIWARGVSRLDGLAITHGDPDHLGGAPGVVRDLRPRHLWEGIDVPRHAPTRELRALASSAGASTRALGRGWRAVVDGVSVRVWHPPPADWERPRVRNDDSLVIEIRWADVSILLTGDVGIDVERELVPLLQPAPIRVVKVAHHGSRSSSAPEFLEAIRPAVAVVSAGRDNRYGHPAERVLRDYARVGARLFRTDRDGAVTLTTDGREVAVTAFRAGSSMVTVRAGTASPSSIPLRALPATDPGGAGLPRPRRTRVSESAP